MVAFVVQLREGEDSMKNFVLASLLPVAAVGCTTTADVGHIQANWTMKSVDASGNTTPTGCPVGFDTAAMHTVAASPDGTLLDPCTSVNSNCFIDLFNCSDMTGVSSALPAQNYLTWLEITTHDGSGVWATSTQGFLDITNVDLSFHTDILVNGGYFRLSWSLMGANSGAPLSCAQTAASSAANGFVQTTATISGTGIMLSDKFTCEDHFGYSAPLPAANYQVLVDARDASNTPIVTQPVQINNTIGAIPNDIVDLGHVVLPIAGQ
jgi:hypothetical protein